MKILVLPGTIWQIPLIKKLKSEGHTVYLVNPVKTTEVVELVDYFFESDIFKFEDIVAYCKKNEIDAVLSDECDIATDLIAKLNKEIGANGISLETAELFTNKYKMREHCEINAICDIPHKLCRDKKSVIEFIKDINTKAIMKPIDSNASHGVFIIENEDDVEKRFCDSIKFSRNEKAVLVEKYIEGTEFTVDGIMTRSGHVTLAISEKDHYKHNTNIANSLYFTQNNTKYDYDELRRVNDELINSTGLEYGLTHVEYKYNGTKFELIEMAARGGGNLISAIIVPFMSGIDNYKYLINCSLNEKYDEKVIPCLENDKTAILKFLDINQESGIVKDIIGEDVLMNEPSIKNYKLNFKIGDYISKPINDSVRVGYYIICADTKEQFDVVNNKINQSFKIVLE